MIILYEKFTRALRWNTIEAILYQGSLIAHQVALFKVISPSDYGIIGALFSMVYLIITIANCGLDASLAPFLTSILASKKSFKNILIPQLVPEACLLALAALGIYCSSSLMAHWLPPTLHLPKTVLLIISCLIMSEGFKKSARALLQLAFYNRITALIDSATIITYITIVWSSYALGYPITIYRIFAPMLFVSTIGAATMAYYILQLYQELPHESEPLKSTSLTRRIFKSRFFNFLTQCSHMLFSGNLLVPLFALKFGLSTAGVFKLISTIAHSITILLNKIFGLTTEAFFAHVKHMDMQAKREAFITITSKLHQTLYCILIFFSINHTTLLSMAGPHAFDAWPMILLFFMIHISEYFFMAYEKFYINEEHTPFLFVFTAATIILLAATLQITLPYGPLIALIALITVRIVSFVIISLASYHRWRIQPQFALQPHYCLGSLAISLLFLWCMS